MDKLKQALYNCHNKNSLKVVKEYFEKAHSTEDFGKEQDSEDIYRLIDEIGVILKQRINELI